MTNQSSNHPNNEQCTIQVKPNILHKSHALLDLPIKKKNLQEKICKCLLAGAKNATPKPEQKTNCP